MLAQCSTKQPSARRQLSISMREVYVGFGVLGFWFWGLGCLLWFVLLVHLMQALHLSSPKEKRHWLDVTVLHVHCQLHNEGFAPWVTSMFAILRYRSQNMPGRENILAFGVYENSTIIRNPQNSIGNYLGSYCCKKAAWWLMSKQTQRRASQPRIRRSPTQRTQCSLIEEYAWNSRVLNVVI